jgi:hypothetical protein
LNECQRGRNGVKYEFLRQLLRIRRRRNTTEHKLARSNLVTAMHYEYGKEEEGEADDFFD